MPKKRRIVSSCIDCDIQTLDTRFLDEVLSIVEKLNQMITNTIEGNKPMKRIDLMPVARGEVSLVGVEIETSRSKGVFDVIDDTSLDGVLI